MDDGVNWRLTAPLKFLDPRGDLHVAHRGFETDFASIPPLAFIAGCVSLVSLPIVIYAAWFHLFGTLMVMAAIVAFAIFVEMVAESFTDDERLDAPAVIHDEGYRRTRLGKSQWVMKFYWDRLLYEAMRANGISFTKSATVWLMLTLFGWVAWFDDGR